MPSSSRVIGHSACSVLVTVGAGLKPLIDHVRLRGHGLHPIEEIGGVLFLRENRLEVRQPRLEVGHLLPELRQLLGGGETLGDVGAQRRELRLARASCRCAPAARSSNKTCRSRPRRARRTRQPARTTGVLSVSVPSDAVYCAVSGRPHTTFKFACAIATHPPSRGGGFHRLAGLLEGGLDRELDQLGRRRSHHVRLGVHDLDRAFEVAGRLEVRHELREPGQRRARPSITTSPPACFSSVSHSICGRARLI